MQLLQDQPDADAPVRSSSTSGPPVDPATWLADVLADPRQRERALWQEERARLRLEGMPLDLVQSAIERSPAPQDAAAKIALYRAWIGANAGSSLLCVAWFNMGAVLGRSGDATNAAIAYRNALVLRPDLHAASINLGLVLEEQGQPEEALAAWQRGIQPDAERASLGIQRGRLLERLGRLGEAEAALRQVLLMDPAQPDVIHHWVHLRQKCCLWPATPDGIPGLSADELLRGSGPLGILALADDIGLQHAAAARWVARKTEPAPRRLAPAAPYGHARIRIGYMSSDFCSHAMSYLITELLERHDRKRFEIVGYCSSQDDGSQLRKRVVAAFDHYRPIRTLSDEEAAQTIRHDEIDLLVDLNGLTEGSRIAVLRWKPAPIQATYLGFIGPLPLPELDFLFCDTMVVPPEHDSAYAPKPLPIARLYQANDSKRTVGRPLTRAEVGLPEDRFVLCCFSRHYKITEMMFAAWMAILRGADRAVLWLAADNAYSDANLRAAAARAGIAAGRIIISERADPDLYLSRLALADLFLDTFPYNAGTVASDAIRMRLPILTLCGSAFASRMAASLLRMTGATAGITTSLTRYAERAMELANNAAAYATFKALFTAVAWESTIGNTGGFTAEYETAIARVVVAARSSGAAGRPVLHTRQTPDPPLLGEEDWADHYREALNHHQAGRLEEAARLYRIALRSRAAPATARFNFGVLCMARDRPAEAADQFRSAIGQQNDMVDAFVNLGTATMALGRLEEAAGLYRHALTLQPDNAMALGNLGKALQDLGQLEEAFGAYHAAHALQPHNAEVLINLGAALLEREDWAGAVTATQEALLLKPEAAIAHANLAVALLHLGQPEAAIGACRQAMAQDPPGAAIAATLGGTLLELGEVADAVLLCRKAVALAPGLANAQFNLSHACRALNLLEEAQTAAEAAVALKPDQALYHFHLAQILLLRGDLPRGWEEYEWRWDLPDFAQGAGVRRTFSQPQWAGEDISGKSILIYTEQGLGDIIQFARYLPLVAARAGRVILAANPATHLLLGAVPGITVIGPDAVATQPFDIHCPLLSLPRAFGTRIESIPAPIAYLFADPAGQRRWSARIGGECLRVGIVWAGNPATKRDRLRSPRLPSIAPLLDVPGVTFIVLQMGPGRADLATMPLPPGVVDLGEEIGDLADTAAVMAGLDLVISSCTAPLHLAGALGRRTWAMIPFAPHFPWLLERPDTPWYPSMRLYRQSRPGLDWSEVVGRIAADLVALRDGAAPG